MKKKIIPKGMGKTNNELFSGLFLLAILILTICSFSLYLFLGGIPDQHYRTSKLISSQSIDDISLFNYKTVIHSGVYSYILEEQITSPDDGDIFEIRKRGNDVFVCVKRKCHKVVSKKTK
jgi:hypothetical protein